MTLTGLIVSKNPVKIDYLLGDQLDLAGLEITGTLSSGQTEVLSGDEYSVSGFDSSTAGSRTVTVTSVANPMLTTAFQVTVTDPSAPTNGSNPSSPGTGSSLAPTHPAGGLATTGVEISWGVLAGALASIGAGAAIVIARTKRRRQH